MKQKKNDTYIESNETLATYRDAVNGNECFKELIVLLEFSNGYYYVNGIPYIETDKAFYADLEAISFDLFKVRKRTDKTDDKAIEIFRDRLAEFVDETLSKNYGGKVSGHGFIEY